MYKGACLCGAVTWTYDGVIDGVTACSCTACRRYGVLWAYGYVDQEIKTQGKTNSFARGGKNLEFHFCPTCGNTAWWIGTKLNDKGHRRIAVNVRLIDDVSKIADIPINHFDGFDKWEDLPRDGRCVKDMWF